MNILTFNQRWFVSSWRTSGHNVVSCGHTSDYDVTLPEFFMSRDEIWELLPADFAPEIIFIFDDGAPYSFPDLHLAELPIIFYSVDTHHLAFVHFGLSEIFDHIFVAQRDFMPGFDSQRSSWLPLWCSKLSTPQTHKEFEALFVGTLSRELNPLRVELITEIQKDAPLSVRQGPFEQFFPKAEIVLNQSVKKDLNFRVFESMGAGALLLTDRIHNGLEDLFEDNSQLVIYEWGNPQDASSKISELLNNRELLKTIAARGRQAILDNHLEMHRAQALLAKVPPKQRRISASSQIHLLFSILIWTLTFDLLHRQSAIKGYSVVFNMVQSLLREKLVIPETTRLLTAFACGCFDLRIGMQTGSRLRQAVEENYCCKLPTPGSGQNSFKEWHTLVRDTLHEIREAEHRPFLH